MTRDEAAMPTSHPVGTTTLAPSRRHAAAYSAVGALVVAMAAWVVVDSAGHALAVTFLVAAVVVAAPFVGQLLAPAAFTWWLGPCGMEARNGGRRVRVAWEDIRLARVVSSAGDPALRLDLGGGGLQASRSLRLPVGADITALHATLAAHLGPVDGTVDRGDGPGSPPDTATTDILDIEAAGSGHELPGSSTEHLWDQ